MKEIHEGRLSFDQPLTPDPKYQINNSGCFRYFRPGFTLPLFDHLMMMIIVSDNVSTGMLVDMLGIDLINDYSRSVGMASTTHRDNIPPSERSPGITRRTRPTPPRRTTLGMLLCKMVDGARDEAAATRLGRDAGALPTGNRDHELAAAH